MQTHFKIAAIQKKLYISSPSPFSNKMTSNKAIQIGKDLDNARCTGNWSAIPELARRFKKYSNSEGASKFEV